MAETDLGRVPDKPAWKPMPGGTTSTTDSRAAHALEHIAICLDRIEAHLAAIANRSPKGG